MLVIPNSFVESTIKREGENGRQWLANLPETFNTLCEAWNLRQDGQPMHGYFGLVVPVVQAKTPAILKISWINEITKDEAAALALWKGNGMVQLFGVQPTFGAMLLERLDYHRTLETEAVAQAFPIAAQTLRRLTVPASGKFPSLRKMAPNIAASLEARWQRLSRPFSQRLLQTAQNRANQFGPTAANMLTNYDLHDTNILAGSREPWLAVDPKPIIGDPEYGLAQLLLRRLEEINAGNGLDYYFDLLIETADLDHQLAYGWTLVRCVDYWLWGLNIGLTEDPARCRIITDWLVESHYSR